MSGFAACAPRGSRSQRVGTLARGETAEILRRGGETLQIDAVDQRIIASLVADARASYAEIGARVSLSAPAVKRRVDRLRPAGVIRGFTAVVDPAARRLDHRGVRRALLHRPHHAGPDRRGRPAAPRGGRRLHGLRRGRRAGAPAGRRHRPPGAGAGAAARRAVRHLHPQHDRAVPAGRVADGRAAPADRPRRAGNRRGRAARPSPHDTAVLAAPPARRSPPRSCFSPAVRPTPAPPPPARADPGDRRPRSGCVAFDSCDDALADLRRPPRSTSARAASAATACRTATGAPAAAGARPAGGRRPRRAAPAGRRRLLRHQHARGGRRRARPGQDRRPADRHRQPGRAAGGRRGAAATVTGTLDLADRRATSRRWGAQPAARRRPRAGAGPTAATAGYRRPTIADADRADRLEPGRGCCSSTCPARPGCSAGTAIDGSLVDARQVGAHRPGRGALHAADRVPRSRARRSDAQAHRRQPAGHRQAPTRRDWLPRLRRSPTGGTTDQGQVDCGRSAGRRRTPAPRW